MATSSTTNREGTPHGVAGEAAAIGAIADLTRAGHRPEIVKIDTAGLGEGLPKTVPVLIRPGRNDVEPLKSVLEHYRTGPERRRGTAVVTTLAAFIALVIRHKDAGSAIFAKTDWPNPALTAVIDYHDEKNAPRHGEHRVHYAFPVTPEFQAWIGMDGRKMDQADFAQFLEEHAAELSSPFDAEKNEYERLFKVKFAAPNELIDLSRSLEVHVGQSVKNAIRLQTGEGEIVFAEEHTGRNGEKITVPGVFMIQLRAFRDGAAVRIPARLRYRVSGGAIVWSCHLYRWEDELQIRVAQDLDEAGSQTGLPTFEGAPESR